MFTVHNVPWLISKHSCSSETEEVSRIRSNVKGFMAFHLKVFNFFALLSDTITVTGCPEPLTHASDLKGWAGHKGLDWPSTLLSAETMFWAILADTLLCSLVLVYFLMGTSPVGFTALSLIEPTKQLWLLCHFEELLPFFVSWVSECLNRTLSLPLLRWRDILITS